MAMKSVEELREDLDSIKEALLRCELTESQLSELGGVLQRLKERLHPESESRSLLELKGLGKDFWRAIDVETYLREERESWH